VNPIVVESVVLEVGQQEKVVRERRDLRQELLADEIVPRLVPTRGLPHVRGGQEHLLEEETIQPKYLIHRRKVKHIGYKK